MCDRVDSRSGTRRGLCICVVLEVVVRGGSKHGAAASPDARQCAAMRAAHPRACAGRQQEGTSDDAAAAGALEGRRGGEARRSRVRGGGDDTLTHPSTHTLAHLFTHPPRSGGCALRALELRKRVDGRCRCRCFGLGLTGSVPPIACAAVRCTADSHLLGSTTPCKSAPKGACIGTLQ